MKLVNRTNIKEIMGMANISPTKNKGQNFLVNEEICKNIVNLLKNDLNSPLIEVGPGLGSLTYHLLNKSNNLSLIDIDDNVISYLNSSINNNVNIIHQDALKYDFSNYQYIISNIPYNITKDLIEHLLISGVNCKQFVFMCQKENFAHFSDTSGSEYGPLSVLIHLLGNIKKAFDVSASNFVPAPKCVSTVFTIDINTAINRKECISTYFLAVKLFKNRRKTILNNLSNIISKVEAIKVLAELGIDPNARAENISPLEYLKLNNIMIGVI